MATTLKCKVQHKDELKILTLPDLSYFVLKTRVNLTKWDFALPAKFKFYYEDIAALGDEYPVMIQVDSQKDLEEAFEFQSVNSSGKIDPSKIRLIIAQNSIEAEQIMYDTLLNQTQQSQRRLSKKVGSFLNDTTILGASFLQTYSDQATQTDKKDFMTQKHQAVCSMCRTGPIIGIMYKCLVCKQFDMCSECEDISEHPHPLIKIKKVYNEKIQELPIIQSHFEILKHQKMENSELQLPIEPRQKYTKQMLKFILTPDEKAKCLQLFDLGFHTDCFIHNYKVLAECKFDLQRAINEILFDEQKLEKSIKNNYWPTKINF